MLTPRNWLVAAVAFWGIALLTAVVGFVVGVEPLAAMSFLLRRLALLVTLVWIILAGAAAVWRSVRPRRRH